MSIIKPVKGKHPEIADDCFIADNATIVGEVKIGSSVAYGLMLWLEAMFIL